MFHWDMVSGSTGFRPLVWHLLAIKYVRVLTENVTSSASYKVFLGST
jgi:hypothetical protein